MKPYTLQTPEVHIRLSDGLISSEDTHAALAPVVAEDVSVFFLPLLSILRQFPHTLTANLFGAVPPKQPHLFLILSCLQSVLSSRNTFKFETREYQPGK